MATKKKTAPEKVLQNEEKVIGKSNEEMTGNEDTLQESISTDSPAQESLVMFDHITVVFPYCKTMAQGKELLYAIRSWQKNVRFGINIVVIGDREDWFSEEITFIEHQRTSDNPQIDILEKLTVALASNDVTEKFIFTADDIYLVNPISLYHIGLPKVIGPLNPENLPKLKADNARRTIAMLDKFGLHKMNYETHTPVLIEKEGLKCMLDKYPEATEGVLVTSLYFNAYPFPARPMTLDWQTDQIKLPIISANPDEKKVQEIKEMLANKVFLNNAESAYSPWLENFLKELFPFKSDFEE